MSNGGFGDTMTKLRGSKYGLILGLSLTAIISILLVLFTWYICFSAMAVAVVMYGVPYYFGFKNRKKLAVFGLVLLVVLGLAWGLNMASSINNVSSETIEKDGYLVGGTVTPIKDLDNHIYTFQVTVLNQSVYKNVTLWIDNSWDNEDSLQYSMVHVSNTTEGMVFEKQLTLNKTGIYAFEYEIWDGEDLISTGAGYGPVNAPSGEITNQAIVSGMFYSFFQIGLLFYMLLFLTWWMERSKTRMLGQVEAAKKKKAEKDALEGKAEEKFVCSECGSEVPGSADKCPQCGEPFDDGEVVAPKETDEKKCPKCNAVIFDTDKKCWNCGRELEGKDKI